MDENSGTRTLELATVVKLSTLINSSLDLQEVLNNAMTCVEEFMQAEASSIWGLDRQRQELFFQLARGKGVDKIKGLRLKLGEGIVGWVAQTRQPLVIADTSSDQRFAGRVDEASGFQTRSILCVPLILKDQLVGVLQVLNKRDTKGFNDADLELLTILGNQIATALENARIHARMQKIFHQAVRALSVTTEMRDPYTAGHQHRVAQLAGAIGTEMGLAQEEVGVLGLAGLLHDIGKIVVPAEILSKPGKLTDLELGIIKTHSQIGYEILKEIDFPWQIATIVLQHHELLDGSGYPQGLREADILPEAKILAVADVMEAISSHRPYRPSLGREIGLEEINRHAGSRYDPQAVAACVRLFSEKKFEFI
jgi:putative nucleotidyltransferase with HDIG domain